MNTRLLFKHNFTKQFFSKYISTNNNYLRKCKTLKFINNNNAQFLPTVYYIHRAATTSHNKNVYNKEESFLSRLIKKIPFFDINRSRLNVAALILYESIVDGINYAEFFDEFSLPDTFYSWFAVTELHLWMLTVRAMVEGEDGRFIRNCMVQALWSDVGLRVKKLGALNPVIVRTQINELSEQFQAALIAYDEGLQSNDLVLAGALWRRLYQQKEVDPEHLDLLVKYIRKQICLLDHIPKEDFLSQKPITWRSRT